MTLSRRDEFAARAMVALLPVVSRGTRNSEIVAVARSLADDLIAELDRTAPKPVRGEIEDDGRELVCTVDDDLVATVGGLIGRVSVSARVKLTPSDARLFAQRILKVCDEVEGK